MKWGERKKRERSFIKGEEKEKEFIKVKGKERAKEKETGERGNKREGEKEHSFFWIEREKGEREKGEERGREQKSGEREKV